MKRVFRIVLSFILAVSLLSSPLLTLPSQAATKYYDVPGGKLIFDTARGSVVGYTGSPANVVIPAKISGIKVKTIGLGAFSKCKSLTSVTLPEGLLKIEDRVFWECENLATIHIPNSVTSIGNWFAIYCNKMSAITVGTGNKFYTTHEGVLYNKAKTVLMRFPGGKTGSYVIPSTVKTISEGAFYSCYTITGVTMPNGLTKIGNEAFCYCFGIKSITLPDSLTTLGFRAFTGVDTEEINVGANNKSFTSIDGVLFNKARTTLLAYPSGRVGSYAIPAGVTFIFDSAFSYSRYLTDLFVPKSVSKVGMIAFLGCNALEAAYFYGNAPTLGQDALLDVSPDFTAYYLTGVKGFSNPWQGHPAELFEADLLPPAGFPDLVVTDIKCSPEQPVKGNEVAFSAAIKNQGTAALDPEMIGSVVFSVDDQPVTASASNQTAVKPGETIILTANTNMYGKSTWTATNGTYKVSVRVTAKTQESRLRNNEYGETVTIVPTDKGTGASSDTFNLRSSASYDMELVPGISWVPANALGKTRFTNAQIAELAKKAPEEKQAQVSSLYEAIQLFQISNFKYIRDNVRIQEGTINWEHHKPGYDAVRTNEGCCASDASWLCYILKNDYEEVGYVAYSHADGSGHIYNYIKEEGYYYVIDLNQYEAVDQYRNRTAPETGIMDDFIYKGAVMGNIVKVKSLTDYVAYLRKTLRNGPGLFTTYTADTVIPTDGVRMSPDGGLTTKMQITYPKGVTLTILYDDPNDNMSLVYAEPPKQKVDWSKLPNAVIVPQTDF